MSQPPLSRVGSPPAGRGGPPITGPIAVGLLMLAAAIGTIAATPMLRPPRDRALVTRLADEGPHTGLCDKCHTAHGNDQPVLYPNALQGPNDNTMCVSCHNTAWAGGSFATEPLYRGTGHGSSMMMIWPGPDPPMRIEPDAPTKCLNCHDPHGWIDLTGTIPHLAIAREEKLCLACHDGSPASSNIATELAKPFRHPVTDYSGRHSGPTESDPSAFGITPINARHAECEDCHNPHVGRRDGTPPLGDDASLTTLGSSRVLVLNGPAGSAPAFTFVPGSDTLTVPVAEYQLCFKCHSSWTTQPAGQTDLARAMNSNNPSYHPTEAPGANPLIDPLSFSAGWNPTSITRCGDCHGSDFAATRGPHGSVYAGLLKASYPASSATRITTSDELCFSCHSYDVYANPIAPAPMLAASRFNPPGVPQGHATHVGTNQVPCYACHVTHGSSTQPFLMATGRNPGLLGYTKTVNGGTCTPTCHGPESYTVNYAR
ncbi:MAG: cytochrome c3 family protein [Candidatus Eisenbacteria bacterium]